MAVTDGKMKLSDGSNTVEVSLPEFPYRIILNLSLDIQVLDDDTVDTYDWTASGDKRACVANAFLTATELNNLNTFIRDAAKGRAKDLRLYLKSGSGFFPFGPDKGDGWDDSNYFTTAVSIRDRGRQESPSDLFLVEFVFRNTGAFPAYSIPAEVSEGNFTIGTITNNRFPPGNFKPKDSIKYDVGIEENSSSQYIDRGANADSYSTQFAMVSNETKCAKVIEYLAATARGAAFNIVSPSGFYPFGRNKSDGTFSVKLLKNRIEIEHSNYNEFHYDLELAYVSGP